MNRGGALRVEFLGDERRVLPGRALTFGRLGDVPLDTNEELPSVVGRLIDLDGVWWVQNESPALDLHVLDGGSRSQMLVPPQTEAPIGFERFTLRFKAGPARYELTASIEAIAASGAEPPRRRMSVSLNAEQRQLLAVLAEPWLDDRPRPQVSTNAAAAARLGWSLTKLNRKLDHLCVKFDRLGVAGLRGSPKHLAADRRQHLVAYCLAAGLITAEDLTTLRNSEGQ